MEGDFGLLLVLLVFLLFGWSGLFMWRRLGDRRGAVNPKGAYPDDPKARVMGSVLDAVIGSIDSNLERTEMSYHPGDPRETMTLIMDIEQFRHLRKRRGMWQHEGIFIERDIERRWARRPAAMREWEGMELVIPIAIKAAFDAGSELCLVRFWVGDMENYALTICRVSVEAKRLQAATEYDWRFDKKAKGYLAPVTPHGDSPPKLAAVGLAEDPYDFEQQVAQMLRGWGLMVEVTGGTGDEGVDIIAYDSAPVTGGMSLIQCKRYSPGKKVGVAEVRELYGTMQEKQAAKGVLVTSSSFTTGALRFAEGKSIELIDGVRLSDLLVGADPFVQHTHHTPVREAVPDVFLDAFSEPTGQAEVGGDPDTADLLEQLDELPQQIQEVAEAGRTVGAYLLQYALIGYSIEGDADGVRRVMAQGVDPDALDETSNPTGALHYAAYFGHFDAVIALLDGGGDVSLRNASGFTPLHNAVNNQHVEIVRLLIERGADVNAWAQGIPPIIGCLFRAFTDGFVSSDNRVIFQMLINGGADTGDARATAEAYDLTDLLDLMGYHPEC